MSLLPGLSGLPVAAMSRAVLHVATSNSSGGGGLSLIFLLLPIAMVVFLIVPQRRQRKEQAALLAKLAVGDEVVTTAGIYGVINFIEDTGIIHLEVDTDVVIRVSKASVSRVAGTPAPGDSSTTSAKAADVGKGDPPVSAAEAFASKLFKKK